MLNDVHLEQVDLNLLVLFEAVFETRNVARAAKVLHLSPSAVSHGLNRLRTTLNDPLFLRTPKGVVPTARANDLGGPIGEVLARARGVFATARPFTPATSTRRFVLGAPDGTAVNLLPALFAAVGREAPGIDLSVVHVLPMDAIAALDKRTIDLALAPDDNLPARFVARMTYDEEFVIAARRGHPFLAKPTTKRYCEALHMLVSIHGDAHGFVDDILAKHGLRRRVALVAPSFLLALATLAETDLLAALPRSLVTMHAKRFDVAWVESPVPLAKFQMHAIVPRAATMDAGLMWLVDLFEGLVAKTMGRKRRPR